jgi:hypothetical protein
MTESSEGLRLESGASVLARDMIQKHMEQFAHVIRLNRVAGQSTAAAYIDGLAGVLALTVAGGHASRDEVVSAAIQTLRECVDRDLRHLRSI